MMSLGVSKGRVIPPTDEDRRRIIKQMKVRTTLKGDKSWIHHHNSDSEDEKKSSPLSGQAGGGSPASTPVAAQNNRSSAPKPQSGYLIRGVFTRTIDKTSSVPDSSSSNEAQKSAAAKRHSLSRSSSGYRMTTEDYKKLAPYNVKQKSVDLDEEDVPFTPDEHKKRTEAANSVLRRTASRERAYVLSAAKKSSGSPTQEFPPLFAKRIEIEEEEGQQRRSPTVSGSCRFTPDHDSTTGLRRTTAGSSWSEPKTTAVSPSSTETGSKSQTTTSSSETSERISTSTEIRNGEDRQALNGKSSSETVAQHGDGDKPLKENSEPFPRDELAPGATVVSTNGSYPEHTEANNGFYPPKDRPADATDKLHREYETSHCLDDAKSEPARSSLQSDVPSPPTESTPVHLEDTEYSFKGSVLGYKESSSTQESRYTSPEVPAHSKPYWNEVTSFQDFKEGSTPRERGHESTRASDGWQPELIQGGFLDSNSHSEKGQEPPDHDVHPEPPRSKERTEHEPSMTRSMPCSEDSTSGSTDINEGISSCVRSEEVTSRRSSSLPRESSVAAPETQCGNEADPCQERTAPAYEEQTRPTTDSHRESPGDWRCNEPNPVAVSRSNFSSKESALSAYETQHPVPLYMDRQPFNSSLSAPSHRIPSYVDSQVFSTRRPTPDYEGRVYDGRSSPRNTRYDSASASGHCEFNPAAGRHDSLPRDTTMSISQRSHRVPFYMDSLNYNSTRLLPSSSERICSPIATLPHNSPAASGYQPDPSSAGKGVLFVKEYVNSSESSASPRYGSGSLVDLTDTERAIYGHHSYLSSIPLQRPSEPICSYCSREIRDCPKIIIEHLNICCHEYCFRCGICHKAMGDLLDKIFIHRDIVHCDKCYEKLF
ncbi:zinc finger protein 185 isoform X1 [Grus americana]|uniref:zinc finger protein 185 isoform X1 n=1 Tax=Grus americana TaxID=9117 RepID=UPI0024084B87|nr:zinc finger protein 185 isoform X1 [Grus americana]XP_054695902.1 zinc finger protein 185 isoform X1 [Grus americana]